MGDNYISINAACPYQDEAFDLLMYSTDDRAAELKMEDNKILPIKNADVEDPYLADVMEAVSQAPSIQLWYDQELAPALAEVHKDTVQQLLGLSITPEEAAAKMEEVAQDLANK